MKNQLQTDWTRYYTTPYKTASITRKITGNLLIRAIKQYVPMGDHLSIIELGGANSAFLEWIIRDCSPDAYMIIDNNQAGLDKTKGRIPENAPVTMINADILTLALPEKADLVFSVGLIEHFDQAGTQNVIKTHFDLVKPGGYVIMTFPTPTWLYQSVRYFAEAMGVWIFHDERPLELKEVLETANEYGRKKNARIIWPIILTQGLVVFQKKGLV